jgi:hypothetical protein
VTVDADMAHVWRRFAARLAGALLAGAVTFAATGLYFVAAQRSQDAEISRLRDQVAASDRQVECRARIAVAAETIRAERDSLGWQALVDRVVAGRTDGLEDRSARVENLNRRLADATDLRAHATGLCADNPDYTPPN